MTVRRLIFVAAALLCGCAVVATSGAGLAGCDDDIIYDPVRTTTTTKVPVEPTTTTTASDAAAPSGSTPTSGATAASGPDAGVTSTSPAGLPIAITPEEIKNAMMASGMGSPEQLQVYDYKNFGHYAAAYVMAADENVYLVLFNDETGGWAILCTYTGLDWEAVQADLRAKAAPEDLIQWAYPGDE